MSAPDWLQQAAAQAGAADPQTILTLPPIPKRRLHFDGDMLAYWAGGSEGMSVAVSRKIARNKIEAMMQAARAEEVVVHLTARDSTKGDRSLVAVTKPYQGNRKKGRKPENWEALRDWMENDNFVFKRKVWINREADDGFAYMARLDPENTVIATKDKDMRMFGCWHMDWDDMVLYWVPPNSFNVVHNEKQYGHKWFWHQMLEGDKADNIPGLPIYNGKPVGEVTARKLLADTRTNAEAFKCVAAAYELHYADTWRAQFMEQAVLLWIRGNESAAKDDVFRVIDTDDTELARLQVELIKINKRVSTFYEQAQAITGAAVS